MSKSTTRTLIVLAVCCYAACQWIFLSRISGCSLFNSHHTEEVAEFQAFTGALAAQVHAACDARRLVLFSDNDIGTPYFVDQLENCRMMRETVVTPFTPEELLNCESVFVSEQHLPSTRASSAAAGSGMDAGTIPIPGMRTIAAWQSSAHHFGFSVSRGVACPRLPGPEG